MGGNAFTCGPSPLTTPRIPPELYFLLRDHYHHRVGALYKLVATPVEAPSKTSYGDIDILVSDPRTETLSPEAIAAQLNTKRTFAFPGGPTKSFAVPYPDRPDNYIQVDLHVCSVETFEWQLFHHSHGDIWNLLRSSIRPVGLTANDCGLHLRMEELEAWNRKKSLLLLTREPDAVLEFLGLDVEKLKKPCGSVEEMYAFVTCCRVFDPERYRREDLKANDRKRMARREIYRSIVEEWIPNHWELLEGDLNPLRPTRREVLEEALNTFGKRDEYEKQLDQRRTDMRNLLTRQEEKAARKHAWAEVERYANA